MPYDVNSDLPESVRHSLPERAQSIYRKAFNHAWQSYHADSRHEEIAHRVAWAAVKKLYVRSGSHWVLKLEA